MKIVITGGGGFLGQRVAKELLRRGQVAGVNGSTPQPVNELVLVDIAQPPHALADPRVRYAIGDASDPRLIAEAFGDDTDGVFHLAAVVSSAAEADFDLGLRVNVDGTRALLEACRRLGRRPRFVFTSSVAVFGQPLPEIVTDATTPQPQNSYGIQKLIGELLVGDYTRKGFLDGRAVRLPTVSIRPGKPNAAASSFASGILREPLNGVEAVCPVESETELWLISPRLAVENLLHAFEVPSEKIGPVRSLSLPGITASVREMVAALERAAGAKTATRIRWQPDPKIKAIVQTWPARFDTARADALGFPRDEGGFDRIIADYLREEGVTI
ncbi:MAG: SDR family oxidoreductase [Verrucomicrobia bacterium]|nr:SDR family oxidoreductase [Verrucomicrobiota bacterium]